MFAGTTTGKVSCMVKVIRENRIYRTGETIGVNNAVFELENEERREVYKILRELTARLSEYGRFSRTGKY